MADPVQSHSTRIGKACPSVGFTGAGFFGRSQTNQTQLQPSVDQPSLDWESTSTRHLFHEFGILEKPAHIELKSVGTRFFHALVYSVQLQTVEPMRLAIIGMETVALAAAGSDYNVRMYVIPLWTSVGTPGRE
jgi:hypothetical protein